MLINQIQFVEEEPTDAQKDAVWGRISKSTSASVIGLSPQRKILRYVVGIAVAASLALLVFNRMGADTKMINEGSEPLLTTLPAASTVE